MSTRHKTRATLINPPPPLSHASPIETILQIYPLTDISPAMYTNAYPLWHPPGARGIYGGAVIAQSLSAAQATIPPDFIVHSMHCYFLLRGDSETPLVYEVERLRDGRSFVTRTVQARQRGRCIFTTTISFMREGSGGKLKLEHQCSMPRDVEPPSEERGSAGLDDESMPFESVMCKVFTDRGRRPEEKRIRRWIRARGRISDGPLGGASIEQDQGDGEAMVQKADDNHQAHLSALAYMSDSLFLGTITRVHSLPIFSLRSSIEQPLRHFQGSEKEREEMKARLETTAREEKEEIAAFGAEQDKGWPQKQVGMTVSLDHSIFFHNPRKFRADEWMLTEMSSPWATEGRGLALQRIWSQDGFLIATCTQEGLVRLKQGKESKL